MTLYDSQLAEVSRVRQEIVTIGVRYCENWYSVPVDQGLESTDDLFVPDWTPTAGTTVTASYAAGPRPGSTNATKLAFAVAGTDHINPFAGSFNGQTANQAFTFTVFLRTDSGSGTVTLRLATGSGSVDKQVTVTTTWTRFQMHFKAGGADATITPSIRREAGDLAAVVAWGANLSKNPGAVDADVVFPYVTAPHGKALDPSVRVSKCTAADAGDGKRCYYSFPTCQDPAHFNSGNSFEQTLNGIREYKFCRSDAPLPLPGVEVWPLLESMDYSPQEIVPDQAFTRNERTNVVFLDMDAPVVWDPQKQAQGALINTASAGRFWRRFVPIFKNYANPDGYVMVKQGFVAAGYTEALYSLRRKLVAANIVLGADNRATLTCADRLHLLRSKVPAKLSDTNVLQADMTNSQTYMDVTNANEFTPAALNATGSSPDYVVTAMIDTEEVNITGLDPVVANRLIITRGRWGTTAATHAKATAISEVWECGTERSTPNLTPLGKNPITFLIEGMMRAGLAATEIDSAGLASERDTWLRSAVDPVAGTSSGVLFRRTITQQTDYETLFQEIREITLLFMWINEAQQVTGKLFAPARPTDVLYELTDGANFVKDSLSVDDQDQFRITQVLVAWSLKVGADGSKPEDFAYNRTRVAGDEESTGYYNQHRVKAILSQWLPVASGPIVDSTSQHYLDRFKHGARLVTATVEIKDDVVQLGAFVNVTTSTIATAAGAPDGPRIMQVVKKTPQPNGNIELKMLDTGIFKRYWFWAPSGTPAYDSQTPAQRRYASWATRVSAIRGIVGAQGDDAYYWW